MEVGGDSAALVGGCLDGAHEQQLPIDLASAQTLCESPGEGYLHEPEEDEAREKERREREPDPAARRRDGGPVLVRLEEERRSVRRPDRQVDLVQTALALLESVLGPAEVAALRVCSPRPQRFELRVLERVSRPDQPRLVGVDDASVGSPDLHPHDSLSEHAFLDDRVETAERRLVTVHHAGAERRFDDALSRERRVLPRVSKRLALADAPEHEDPGDDEHGQHEQARQGELHDGARHRGRVGCRGSRGCSGLRPGMALAVHAWLSIAVVWSDRDGVGPMSHCGPDLAPDRVHRVNARVERRRR